MELKNLLGRIGFHITIKEIKEEASKYKTKYELYKANRSIYCAAYRRGLLDELYPYTKMTKEYFLEVEQFKYKNNKDFRKRNIELYRRAYRNKWLQETEHLNCNKSLIHKWTKEKLIEERNKYKSNKDFRIKSHAAYESARMQGFLNELCPTEEKVRKII